VFPTEVKVRMKLTPIIMMIFLITLAISPALAKGPPPHSPQVYSGDLIVGKSANLDVGDLRLYTYYSATEGRALAFMISMAPGWEMTAIYVDVQSDPSNFPMNRAGNPKPGQFWFTEEGMEGTVGLGTNTGFIPCDVNAPMTLCIAVHAIVYNAELGISEGAWMQGLTTATNGNFPGANWATYVYYESPAIYSWLE
jgi:hypothetical protein